MSHCQNKHTQQTVDANVCMCRMHLDGFLSTTPDIPQFLFHPDASFLKSNQNPNLAQNVSTHAPHKSTTSTTPTSPTSPSHLRPHSQCPNPPHTKIHFLFLQSPRRQTQMNLPTAAPSRCPAGYTSTKHAFAHTPYAAIFASITQHYATIRS